MKKDSSKTKEKVSKEVFNANELLQNTAQSQIDLQSLQILLSIVHDGSIEVGRVANSQGAVLKQGVVIALTPDQLKRLQQNCTNIQKGVSITLNKEKSNE